MNGFPIELVATTGFAVAVAAFLIKFLADSNKRQQELLVEHLKVCQSTATALLEVQRVLTEMVTLLREINGRRT